MALIYCPECGTQVSEHAQQCIKCAYPIYKLKVNNPNNQTYSNSNLNSKISQPTNYNNEPSNGLIISGYIVGFMGLLILPMIFLLAGVIIGIITISKGYTVHGIAHIVLAIMFATLGAAMGGWGLIF